MSDQQSSLFCARCSKELTPGAGDFYEVRIEALADPSPPLIEDRHLHLAFGTGLKRLVHEAEDISAQEAMDQVYRRYTMHLCNTCYQQWIENPTG